MYSKKELVFIIIICVFAVLLDLFFLGSGIYMIIDGAMLLSKGVSNLRSVGHLVVGIIFVLSSLSSSPTVVNNTTSRF